MTALEGRLENHNGVPVVVLTGEIDLATIDHAERLLREAEEEAPHVMAADLRRVSFIDSTGLRLFVQIHRRAEQADRRFALVRGPDNVQRVFQVTKLDERFWFVDDPQELMAG